MLNLSNEMNLKNSVKCLGLFVCVVYHHIPLSIYVGKQVNPLSSDIAVAAYTNWGRSATGVAISHPSKVRLLGVEFCACFPKSMAA